MQNNYSKFAGLTLCLISVLLLAGLGKLDLLIVLLPTSLLWTFFVAKINRRKDGLTDPTKRDSLGPQQ